MHKMFIATPFASLKVSDRGTNQLQISTKMHTDKLGLSFMNNAIKMGMVNNFPLKDTFFGFVPRDISPRKKS